MGGRVIGCSQRTCSLSEGKPSAVCLLESSFRNCHNECFSSWFTAWHSLCLIDSHVHYMWMIWEYHRESTWPMIMFCSSHTSWSLWFCTIGSRKALQGTTMQSMFKGSTNTNRCRHAPPCSRSLCMYTNIYIYNYIYIALKPVFKLSWLITHKSYIYIGKACPLSSKTDYQAEQNKCMFPISKGLGHLDATYVHLLQLRNLQNNGPKIQAKSTRQFTPLCIAWRFWWLCCAFLLKPKWFIVQHSVKCFTLSYLSANPKLSGTIHGNSMKIPWYVPKNCNQSNQKVSWKRSTNSFIYKHSFLWPHPDCVPIPWRTSSERSSSAANRRCISEGKFLDACEKIVKISYVEMLHLWKLISALEVIVPIQILGGLRQNLDKNLSSLKVIGPFGRISEEPVPQWHLCENNIPQR